MPFAQVYLILDEFILGGEIQESSKRVSVVASGAACADGDTDNSKDLR